MINKKFRTLEEKTGHVYILSNPLYPSLVKIGSTKKHPEVRASQITKQTGVLGIFIVEWFVEVDITCYEKLERRVHEELKLYRFLNYKEFFEISLEQTIEVAKRIIKEWNEDIVYEYLNAREAINPLELERRENLKQPKIFYNQYEQYEIKIHSENQNLQKATEELQHRIKELEEERKAYIHNLENLISDNKKYQYLLENSEKIVTKFLSCIFKFMKIPKRLAIFSIKLNNNELNYVSSILEETKKDKKNYLKDYIIESNLFDENRKVLIDTRPKNKN
jgi:hypothetical protein